MCPVSRFVIPENNPDGAIEQVAADIFSKYRRSHLHIVVDFGETVILKTVKFPYTFPEQTCSLSAPSH